MDVKFSLSRLKFKSNLIIVALYLSLESCNVYDLTPVQHDYFRCWNRQKHSNVYSTLMWVYELFCCWWNCMYSCNQSLLSFSDFNALFKYLGTVQGNLDTRCAFVRDIIHEAMRFKRKSLITQLKQFEESLVRAENKTRKAKVLSPSTVSWWVLRENESCLCLCLLAAYLATISSLYELSEWSGMYHVGADHAVCDGPSAWGLEDNSPNMYMCSGIRSGTHKVWVGARVWQQYVCLWKSCPWRRHPLELEVVWLCRWCCIVWWERWESHAGAPVLRACSEGKLRLETLTSVVKWT